MRGLRGLPQTPQPSEAGPLKVWYHLHQLEQSVAVNRGRCPLEFKIGRLVRRADPDVNCRSFRLHGPSYFERRLEREMGVKSRPSPVSNWTRNLARVCDSMSPAEPGQSWVSAPVTAPVLIFATAYYQVLGSPR
jgi:hypothetical protein